MSIMLATVQMTHPIEYSSGTGVEVLERDRRHVRPVDCLPGGLSAGSRPIRRRYASKSIIKPMYRGTV